MNTFPDKFSNFLIHSDFFLKYRFKVLNISVLYFSRIFFKTQSWLTEIKLFFISIFSGTL